METKPKIIKKTIKTTIKPRIAAEKSALKIKNAPQVSVNSEQKIQHSRATYIKAVGRRKTAVARVRLFQNGSGNIMINSKNWKDYFSTSTLQNIIFSPIKLTSLGNDIDFTIKVIGGGTNSQAEAIRHGIARALFKFNSEFKPSLKKAGFLTRDSRKKERKKPGLKRARRAPQWKKR